MKVDLRGKFIVLRAYIKKIMISHINKSTKYLKCQEQSSQREQRAQIDQTWAEGNNIKITTNRTKNK